jgi:predicted MPP superfamily phosphohydrolase
MPIGRLLLFLAVALSIVFGVHYFLWVRLVRDPAWPAGWTRGLTWALVVFGASIPLGIFASRGLSRQAATPFAWLAYTWMGVMFLLFFSLLPAELVRAGARLGGVDPERRLALARILSVGAGLLSFVTAGAGVASVLSRVGVKQVRVPIAKLPKALSGYTIVQLTDVHVGPTIGRDFIEQIVRTTNTLSPDLVAITGDLVDGSVEELGHLVEPLRELRAKDGVFFVTGNHEYYSGVDAWIAHLRTLGIRVLRNERVPIRGAEGDAGFDLAGVDDTSAHNFGHGHGQDVPGALAGRDASRAVVLLAHQPKAVRDASKLGVDLQLSGHTHGGQIWPWGYAVRLDQPHVAGLHDHEGTAIYVSRGTGYWGPPMRVAAPAEITRIELVAG